ARKGDGVRASRKPLDREDTMRTTHRFSAALTRPWLIAAAALATLTTMIFLLHPPATHADPSSGTVVSTAKTSLGRILVNSRGHTLYLFERTRTARAPAQGCARPSGR